MKYPLQSIALFSFAILVLSCSHKDPTPDTSPYLYIHSGKFQDNELEKWIIVTNGNEELVGYKKIDPTSDETVLTQRSASIKDKINIYKIYFYSSNAMEIKAVLGVDPGEHCYLGSKVTSASKDLNANLYKIPIKSRITPGSGSFGLEQRGFNSDGTIDSAKINFLAWESISVHPLTVYTRAAPKYVNVNYSSTGVSKFNYPGDFLNFDHVIDVPTGKTPVTVITSGTKGGFQIYFTSLLYPDDMDRVDANQSVKLCYNNGYDSYSTWYLLDNNSGYSKNGGIPSSTSRFMIPNRSIVVNNHDLFSFAATIPVEIDYRTSGYSYSEVVGSKTKSYSLSITVDVTRSDAFDLKLPNEFVTAHGSSDFTKYNHTGTTFYEFENDEKYSNAVDNLFAVPGNSVGQYYYYVN
ncbi:MAG TPA: hypothetical protein VGQ59_19590 [Cyclobacteriaceae bacterium]|jgi:hypothetical protein|nr:hypothetical protein [Cyclobacteriaceae bacterium]